MSTVSLQPWSDDDLETLRRSNAPEMMTYLGGPETEQQLVDRHERYLRLGRDGTARMFRIVVPGHPDGVGVIGHWATTRHDRDALEVGWSVETAYQGRGIATAALLAVLDDAARHHPDLVVYAFPKVENAASNAICRKAGMLLEGTDDFEYPAGNPIVSNVWSHSPGN